MSALPAPIQNPINLMVAELAAIRTRSSYSFRLVQHILRQNNMETAAGWDLLIDKYKSLDPLKINSAQYLSVLKHIYFSSISSSNTAVWVYDAPAVDAARLIAAGPGAVQKTVFSGVFPYPVDLSTLAAAPYNGEYVGCFTNGGNLILFSCAKRAFRSRETIDLASINPAVLQSLGGFDELVGFKSGFVQAFDRTVIYPSGRVEFHVDLCCNMSEEDLEQCKIYYVSKFKSFAQSVLGGIFNWLDWSRNFFPKIQDLYNNTDGDVHALQHTTSTKSVKEERMRSKKLDLRKETFHIEGMKSIPSTDLFAIKKGWQSADESHSYTVSIPGKLPVAGSGSGVIRYALIEGCENIAEFECAVGKIL